MSVALETAATLSQCLLCVEVDCEAVDDGVDVVSSSLPESVAAAVLAEAGAVVTLESGGEKSRR